MAEEKPVKVVEKVVYMPTPPAYAPPREEEGDVLGTVTNIVLPLAVIGGVAFVGWKLMQMWGWKLPDPKTAVTNAITNALTPVYQAGQNTRVAIDNAITDWTVPRYEDLKWEDTWIQDAYKKIEISAGTEKKYVWDWIQDAYKKIEIATFR